MQLPVLYSIGSATPYVKIERYVRSGVDCIVLMNKNHLRNFMLATMKKLALVQDPSAYNKNKAVLEQTANGQVRQFFCK